MNDLLEPLLNSFESFSRTLAELQGKSLEERSIQGIIVLTQKIDEMGDRCKEFREGMAETGLNEKAKQFDLSFILTKVQGQLDRLVVACQGKSSYTVKDLQALIWTWKRDFQELQDGIARSEKQSQIKAKPVDLLLRLQNLQNEVFNSPHENSLKLSLLKRLMGLEETLQSLEKQSEKGEIEWESLDYQLNEIQTKLTAIATELK
ncbi:MAG: hypothetical protein AAGA60_17320 [Cyanobacteria bacterium P01_E01_bin.42]